MRQSTADPCLYLSEEDGELMTVNVHVDDCCICYSSEKQYQRFRKRLETEFQISKSDDSNSFLGMIIERLGADEDGKPILCDMPCIHHPARGGALGGFCVCRHNHPWFSQLEAAAGSDRCVVRQHLDRSVAAQDSA